MTDRLIHGEEAWLIIIGSENSLINIWLSYLPFGLTTGPVRWISQTEFSFTT